jgi:outer membrane protein TolC
LQHQIPNMLNTLSKRFLLLLSLVFGFTQLQAQQLQPLGIKDAIRIGLENYGTIKAKNNQLNSSKAQLTETKTEYLPDLNLSAQNVYGTINGQNGPAYGYGGFATAASGPALPNQNWNATFGSLYVANVNWNFFAFGRAVEKVKVQSRVVDINTADLNQERFEEEVRVSSAYLNDLVAQQLVKANYDNLYRSIQVQKVVLARVKNGLNPGVDSSLANAQVANAQIAYIQSQETEKEQATLLSQYLGSDLKSYELDSTFVTKVPINMYQASQVNIDDHPVLQYYNNLIKQSDEQAKYLSTFSYPTFTLFGLYQGRGSGFKSGYSTNQSDYNFDSSYGAGADPTRYNYLLGVGVTWDITNPFRVHYQVRAQKFISDEYRDQYNLQSQNLRDELALAETKIVNAVNAYNEAPVEVKAASDAYKQKFALYQNGLATIVDFQEALYALNRAEIDQAIASNTLWQALLYKAGASGDFNIFINNF